MPQESLNNITTLLASHFDREQDEPFKRMLAVPVDYWRSKLVTNSLEKHPEQRKFYKQSIIVPMHMVDPIHCPVPMDLCQISKSVNPIPKTLRLGGILYDYVGSIDGNQPFREASAGQSDYLKAGRYSKKTIFWGKDNEHIKIINKPNIPSIRIDGVFDKPIDVMMLNCASGVDCDYWDMPYPCTGDILQMIIQYILQVDFQKNNTPMPDEIEVNPNKPKNPQEPQQQPR